MSPFERMVVSVTVMFLVFKIFTRPHSWAYAVAWPGMDPRPFRVRLASDRTAARWIGWGALKMALGFGLLAFEAPILAKGWLAIASMLLVIHLGLFDMLAGFWRLLGYPVERICPEPWLARSLSEFWGERWNMAFHVFARDQIYRPLSRRLGRTAAIAAVFLFSGIVHDLVISFPAGGGWGLPTLYFVIHGALVWMEKRRVFSPTRWTTAIFVLFPLPLVFHGPFMSAVIYPMVMP